MKGYDKILLFIVFIIDSHYCIMCVIWILFKLLFNGYLSAS